MPSRNKRFYCLLPFARDVGHLELDLRGGKPGIGSLWPKLAELHLAWSLLLLLGTRGRLLGLVFITDGSQHRQEGVPHTVRVVLSGSPILRSVLAE